MLQLINRLENHLLSCPGKMLSGFDCPGCGMQRSFIELLKGNFLLSFHLYPALLPIIFTLGLTGVHLYFKLKNGAEFIKYSFIFSITIIVVSYSIKMTLCFS